MILSSIKSNKSQWLLSVAIAAVIGGSFGAAYARAQTTAPATAPASTQAATQPTFGNVTATVNGENITRDQFQLVLEAISGLKVFDQLLQLVVLEQACKNAGIDIGNKEVQEQKDAAIQELKDQGVPNDQLDQALAMVIQRQGLTGVEFDLLLRRNAYMHAMAKGHGEVTQDQLDQAFKNDTGRHYILVDTQLPDMSDAVTLRNLVEKDHKPIAEAGQSIKARQQRFQLSEYADETQIPKAVIDQTKNLKEGELSALIPITDPKGGPTTSHMLYLEKIEPAKELKAGEIADYKEKLKAKLIQAAELNWGNEHLKELMSRAQIEIKDPFLLQMYQQVQKMRDAAATQAAAGKPGATTAPAAPK